MNRLVRAYIMFLFTWQTLFRVSDAGMGVLFMFIAVLFALLASALHIETLNNFVSLLPRRVAAAKKLLDMPQIHSPNMQAVLSAIPSIQ
jgi:hypothetical protein